MDTSLYLQEETSWIAHRRQCEEGVIGGMMAEPRCISK